MVSVLDVLTLKICFRADLESEIAKIRQVSIPRDSDLAGAALSLLRVQHTYNLNLTDLARGDVWGFRTKAGLNAQDCLYVGQMSYNQGMFARAVEWFEEAYRLAGVEQNPSVNQHVALQFLTNAVRAVRDTPDSPAPVTSLFRHFK